MAQVQTILELLGRRRGLFEQYEKETEELLTCDVDREMEVCIARRERLIGEINRLEDELIRQCGEDAQLLDAARARCNWGELPEERRPVFDAAREIIAVITRVQRLEPEIVARMENERDALEKQIRTTNRSQAAQAARYSGSVGGGRERLRSGPFGKV